MGWGILEVILEYVLRGRNAQHPLFVFPVHIIRSIYQDFR